MCNNKDVPWTNPFYDLLLLSINRTSMGQILFFNAEKLQLGTSGLALLGMSQTTTDSNERGCGP